MWHATVGPIVQMELDHVALANPNKISGNLAAEGPERILNSIGQAAHVFFGLQIDYHSRGVVPGDRWWDARWGYQNGDFFAGDLLAGLVGTAQRKYYHTKRGGSREAKLCQLLSSGRALVTPTSL
jgi:hypothetical protein